MADWTDELSDLVRRLERGVSDHDRLAAEKARSVLRVLRVYETRLRRVSLRAKVMFDDSIRLR